MVTTWFEGKNLKILYRICVGANLIGIFSVQSQISSILPGSSRPPDTLSSIIWNRKVPQQCVIQLPVLEFFNNRPCQIKKKKRKQKPRSKFKDPPETMGKAESGQGAEMQFRPAWARVTSSESEYSDTEGAQRAK